VRKDGSVVWVNLTVSLQRDADGAPDHFVSVVEDIDERKQAEEALGQSRRELQALNASLEQRVAERTAQVQRLADQLHALAVQLSRTEQRERKRVARILHDHIQQLLVAARMQLAAARRDHDVERVQSMLLGADAVLQEAVDASRSVAIELSPPILHQAGLIGGLKWLAARMAESNDFRVHLRADETAEPAAEELRLLLFECVRELLFNALKHSGAREAHVALDRAGDGSARIVVQDEGRGFDPEQLRTRQAGDLTFGLFSIQQRLVDIGGEMAIDAAPGRGTRITLAVPLGEGQPAPAGGEPSAPAAAPAAALEPAGRTGKIRVLLVDDHRILREGLAGLLQFEADIEVVGEAADGPQAVALAEELRPDVVTMDVSMPGMSGPEATRIILGKLPQARVIGLSMHIDGGVADAMRQAGAVSYLTKGGPSEDLVAAIRACRPN
jgi:signal transduction histidine kinase